MANEQIVLYFDLLPTIDPAVFGLWLGGIRLGEVHRGEELGDTTWEGRIPSGGEVLTQHAVSKSDAARHVIVTWVQTRAGAVTA